MEKIFYNNICILKKILKNTGKIILILFFALASCKDKNKEKDKKIEKPVEKKIIRKTESGKNTNKKKKKHKHQNTNKKKHTHKNKPKPGGKNPKYKNGRRSGSERAIAEETKITRQKVYTDCIVLKDSIPGSEVAQQFEGLAKLINGNKYELNENIKQLAKELNPKGKVFSSPKSPDWGIINEKMGEIIKKSNLLHTNLLKIGDLAIDWQKIQTLITDLQDNINKLKEESGEPVKKKKDKKKKEVVVEKKESNNEEDDDDDDDEEDNEEEE